MRIKSKYTIKYIRSLALLLSSLLFSACPSVPEFPIAPSINFEEVKYFQEETIINPDVSTFTDVIELTIYFEDGNGDLGLSTLDLEPPYQPYFYRFTEDNIFIFINDSDTLPEYNTLDYLTLKDEKDTLILDGRVIMFGDTLYKQTNPRHNNIFIKTFYQPNPNGNFIEYKWDEAPYYQSFDGRFPILNSEEYERPLSGSITYKIKSSGFLSVFKEDPIIIESFILDRAGNKSNIVRSEPFKLQ